MKKVFSILFFLSSIITIAQTTVYNFEYDASGNRIKRYITIEPIAMEAPPLEDSVLIEEPELYKIAERSMEKDTALFEKSASTLNSSHSTTQFSEIYPNPTNGNINVKVNQGGIYLISDINGKVLQRNSIFEGINSIDISNNEPGTYLLKLAFKDGKVETWKVSKI